MEPGRIPFWIVAGIGLLDFGAGAYAAPWLWAAIYGVPFGGYYVEGYLIAAAIVTFTLLANFMIWSSATRAATSPCR